MARTNGLLDKFALAKALTGLANARGGRLIIGVEDDRTISGVGTLEQLDALMRQVSQVASDGVSPSLYCEIGRVEVEGHIVVYVEVQGFSPGRPYAANGRYYVRDVNRTRECSREELQRIFQSWDHHFDEQPVAGATLEDLDLDRVRAFLETAYAGVPAQADLKSRLHSLKCLDRSGEPTVAGMLMFGREPTRWLLDARVTVVRPRGNTATTDVIDKKEFTGPVLEQIDGALGFLQVHVPAPSSTQAGLRVERGLPLSVLREVVVNAVVHRDYRVPSQVRVFVYDDRVEVINPGALLNNLTLDSIRIGGISQRRNPVMASLLARALRRKTGVSGSPRWPRSSASTGCPTRSSTFSPGTFA